MYESSKMVMPMPIPMPASTPTTWAATPTLVSKVATTAPTRMSKTLISKKSNEIDFNLKKERPLGLSFFCLWFIRGFFMPSLCPLYGNGKTTENQSNTHHCIYSVQNTDFQHYFLGGALGDHSAVCRRSAYNRYCIYPIKQI